MTPDQAIQLRFNIALKMGDSKTVDGLEAIYKWVVGPQSSIIPARQMEIVKQ